MECPHQQLFKYVDAGNLILKNLLNCAVEWKSIRGHSLDIVGVLVLFIELDRAENSSGRAPICNWEFIYLYSNKFP